MLLEREIVHSVITFSDELSQDRLQERLKMYVYSHFYELRALLLII